jgi:hypothetical protein
MSATGNSPAARRVRGHGARLLSSFMEGERKVEAGAFNAEARRGGGRRGVFEEV